MKTEKSNKMKYFIGMDVHKSTTWICVLDKEGVLYDAQSLPTTELALRTYLQSLPKAKGLVMEETDLAQWLYSVLHQEVDELVVCDPYRNKSLRDGAKTDRLDAKKLADLYRGGQVREVYHSTDRRMGLRRLVSCYRITMKTYVQSVNQYKAIFRQVGEDEKRFSALEKQTVQIQEERMALCLGQIDILKELLEKECFKYPEAKILKSIPGIGPIGTAKLIATVIDPHRFGTKHKFWSYCGLVKHPRESAGKRVGKNPSRANRTLKGVFKTAAETTLRGEGPMQSYYLQWREKGVSERNAKNAVARKIAAMALICWKHKKRFDPQFERKERLRKAS